MIKKNISAYRMSEALYFRNRFITAFDVHKSVSPHTREENQSEWMKDVYDRVLLSVST